MSPIHICAICEVSATLVCKGCKNEYYCSAEHQKEHWKKHKAQCCTVTLKVSEELNRYFVASRKLKAGTIILDEAPTIYGPWISPSAIGSLRNLNNNEVPNSKDCIFCISCCKRILRKPYSCTKCKWPFCNAACSKVQTHTLNECKHFRANKVKFSSSTKLSSFLIYRGILILRGLLKSKSGLAADESEWKTLLNLQYERSTGNSSYDLTSEDITYIKSYLNMGNAWTDEECRRINGLIDVNAFSITRAEDQHESPSEVTAVFPNSSIFAHSCSPNACWGIAYSPKFTVRIRASKTIEKGEIISISYNHAWTQYGSVKRRKMILDIGGFICKCIRCMDPSELGTFSEGFKCDKCEDYLLPHYSQELLNIKWKCNNSTCSRTGDSPNDLDIISKLNSIEAEWNEINSAWKSILVVGWMLVEKFISNYSKILHPNHWIIQQATRSIILTLGFNLKSLEPNILENFIKHCDYLLAVANILTPGVSLDRGLLELYLSRALFIKYQNYIKNGGKRKEHLELLERIHELQKDALLFWTDDIQSRPLKKELGYEASCLHDETLLVLSYIASESQTVAVP